MVVNKINIFYINLTLYIIFKIIFIIIINFKSKLERQRNRVIKGR